MRLTEKGISLLRSGRDGTFLGVIDDTTVQIDLFSCSRIVSVERDEYPGHRQLLEHKRIPSSGVRGFSFTIYRGEISAFYRNSLLNLNLRDESISVDDVNMILGELGLEVRISRDIRIYP
jgi:hypothetical protein